jgi:hypothetical protein
MESCIKATGACNNEAQGYFLLGYWTTSQENPIVITAANNKGYRHVQIPTSYPAQRPVPDGAVFQSRRRGNVADVLRNLKMMKFVGLAIVLRSFKHFCKSSVRK